MLVPVLIWLAVLLSFLEFRSHGGAAGIDPNGQSHGDRVGETSQIDAFTICLSFSWDEDSGGYHCANWDHWHGGFWYGGYWHPGY
jgi:hypothetical protein